MKEILTKTTLDLLKINSENPPGNEEGVIKYILTNVNGSKKLQDKQRCNVFVPGNIDLLLVCHVDTVPIGTNWKNNPLGQKVNNRIYGRGACDNKGNLAVILELLKNKKRPSALFTISEETDFKGIKEFLKQDISGFSQVVVMEPTENKVVLGNKGVITAILEIKGKAAHASMPEKGDNAIIKCLDLVEKLNNYSKELDKKTTEFGRPTLNIGTINGGRSSNIVPDSCVVKFERRVVIGEGVDEIKQEIIKICGMNVKFINEVPAVYVGSEQKIAKQFLKLTNVVDFPGTTELSFFKIPGVVFGAGSPKQAHVTDEFVEIKSLVECYNILKELIEKW